MNFSQPGPIKESDTMRRRIGAEVSSIALDNDLSEFLTKKIKTEAGLDVPWGIAAPKFENFFESISLSDCLNSIRIIYEATVEHSRRNRPRGNRIGDAFKLFVNRVFKEEGLPYLMADDGSVKFNPDEEFEANRTLTLKGLTDRKFNAALTAFNHAYSEFNSGPEKYKSALRYIFEANEIVFKTLTSERQLNESFIDKHKSILIDPNADATSIKVLEEIRKSFKYWVNALHYYRHGQNVETYDNPTLELTILAMSNGAAYLRWLVSIVNSNLK